jgi:hypothetical protein
MRRTARRGRGKGTGTSAYCGASPLSPPPSLDELRARVHKGRHREIGNWLARRWARPSAVYGTWLAVRLGCGAHAITTLALLAGIASAAAIGTGTRAGFGAGVLLAFLAFWLDRVDGQVARWWGTARLGGVYFDYLMHHVHALATGFALGYGLAVRTGDVRWSLAGMLVGGGWLFLGLHNDCRYKAFFQRLKAETRTYRVDGGSGGRPSPPSPWPRRGRGALTWPLFKLCEPHVVLVTLGGLALLPIGWEGAWKAYVLGMAATAPGLAAARAGRAVARDSISAEFDRWFRPG